MAAQAPPLDRRHCKTACRVRFVPFIRSHVLPCEVDGRCCTGSAAPFRYVFSVESGRFRLSEGGRFPFPMRSSNGLAATASRALRIRPLSPQQSALYLLRKNAPGYHRSCSGCPRHLNVNSAAFDSCADGNRSNNLKTDESSSPLLFAKDVRSHLLDAVERYTISRKKYAEPVTRLMTAYVF